MDTNPFGTVIFDIETVSLATVRGEPVPPSPAEGEEERQPDALSPLFGQVVSIGVLDAESDRGAVYYVTSDGSLAEDEEDGIKYIALDEAGALERFWEVSRACKRLVGFNSRSFDGPFLNVRSAVNNLRPSVDLMSNRYLGMQKRPQHVDLMDQLNYYGSTWPRRGTLHDWCVALDIPSPKEEGVSGGDVDELYRTGRHLDIARYNARDIFATRELYRRWDQLLNFQK